MAYNLNERRETMEDNKLPSFHYITIYLLVCHTSYKKGISRKKEENMDLAINHKIFVEHVVQCTLSLIERLTVLFIK